MSEKKLPIPEDTNQSALQGEIQILQQELARIQQETLAFETLLRSHLSDLIVEAQEFFEDRIFKLKKRTRKGC